PGCGRLSVDTGGTRASPALSCQRRSLPQSPLPNPAPDEDSHPQERDAPFLDRRTTHAQSECLLLVAPARVRRHPTRERPRNLRATPSAWSHLTRNRAGIRSRQPLLRCTLTGGHLPPEPTARCRACSVESMLQTLRQRHRQVQTSPTRERATRRCASELWP